MSVVIIVLKIIGGVLLFLLGFLLLVLCLVFFVPVRYRVLAKLLEGQETKLLVQGKLAFASCYLFLCAGGGREPEQYTDIGALFETEKGKAGNVGGTKQRATGFASHSDVKKARGKGRSANRGRAGK